MNLKAGRDRAVTAAGAWAPKAPGGLLLVLRMDVLVALANGEVAEALDAARRRVEIADEPGRLLDRVSARVHLADALARTGDSGGVFPDAA